MPRHARSAPGGLIYHVLNRGVGRMELFSQADDYAAFERCLRETQEVVDVPLLCYCLMPNHWHLVLEPRGDGDMGRFMQRLTLTHARRWQEHRRLHGTGHVYQGRYKSFPIQDDEHFLTVARYVERNAVRANLCKRAEAWRWSSLWRRRHPDEVDAERPALSRWPMDAPRGWLRTVNAALSERALQTVRVSASRGRPFGGDDWVTKVTKRLGLESTFRPRGRPKQAPQQR